MPFGLFVGVNNHFQSIILAGVLVRDGRGCTPDNSYRCRPKPCNGSSNKKCHARISYKVTVVDGGEEFDCECEQFAHMGLLCSHVLKVLDFIRITEIPQKHIEEMDQGCKGHPPTSSCPIPEGQCSQESI